MKIRRIVPDITGLDFRASKEFYATVLGLQCAMDLGWVTTFVSPNNQTAQITIIQKDQTAPMNPHISIEVEDVMAVFSTAQAAGADIVYPLTEEPWGVRRFFVRDPNGVIINVLSQE